TTPTSAHSDGPPTASETKASSPSSPTADGSTATPPTASASPSQASTRASTSTTSEVTPGLLVRFAGRQQETFSEKEVVPASRSSSASKTPPTEASASCSMRRRLTFSLVKRNSPPSQTVLSTRSTGKPSPQTRMETGSTNAPTTSPPGPSSARK